ncbi:MAG TPA: holo-ACP synthase [Anaerolineae bacterium]|jgi:holo-[acyl-carrier protein] synthase|nr:holo-ACP synthase [Anaerolineae bacterium]
MLSTGVDILYIPRVEKALERYGQRFLDRCFTAPEIRSCRGFASEFAARYAAKEAVSKTLGVGLRIMARNGIKFHDVEILPDRYGKPYVHLHGYAAERAQELGLKEWAVSLTHEKEYTVAFVVAM